MTIEEMQKELTQLHNDQFQTKLLNIILNIYNEIKGQQRAIIELQQKVNEIVNILNAASVNTQEDVLVNKPAPQVSEEDK